MRELYRIYYKDGNQKLFESDNFTNLLKFLYWERPEIETRNIIKIELVVAYPDY